VSFYRTTLQKDPRKHKTCFWCGETCPAGEPRLSGAWMFEGDFCSGHYHLECDAAYSKWRKENPGEEESPEPYEMRRGKTISRSEEVAE